MSTHICQVSQGFGGNANEAYKKGGLSGHPGVDSSCGYGTPVYSRVSGLVVGTYTPDKPALDGYTGVYILCKTRLETFEWCTGHLSRVDVKVGDFVKKGQQLGLEGNKGLVYYGGIKITLAMQKAGDKRGSHRHEQKRPVRIVKKRSNSKRYLMYQGSYLRSPDGGYYEYAIDNNFAGCVNFARPLLDRDLFLGVSGYDVELLQRALGLPVDLQTGYFGLKTQAAVSSFQKEHGLYPLAGYCGAKTRGVLNLVDGHMDTI